MIHKLPTVFAPRAHVFAVVHRRLIGLVCLVTACMSALEPNRAMAHGGGGDVAVFTTNGKADVGFAVLDENDVEQIQFDPDDSVFTTILAPGALFGLALSSTEPGLDANEGDLPANARLSVRVQELLYWDGVGSVSLSAAQGVQALFFPDFVSTDSQGGFHWHPLYGMRDLTNDGQPIPDGVYVAKATVRVVGLAESDPYYLVTLADQRIGQAPDPEGAAETLGEGVRAYQADPANQPPPTLGGKNFAFYAEAINYVERLAVVPEPTSTGFAWLAALLAARQARSERPKGRIGKSGVLR